MPKRDDTLPDWIGMSRPRFPVKGALHAVHSITNANPQVRTLFHFFYINRGDIRVYAENGHTLLCTTVAVEDKKKKSGWSLKVHCTWPDVFCEEDLKRLLRTFYASIDG